MPSDKRQPTFPVTANLRPRVAVVVRAHFDCEKLRDLTRILKTGTGYELFVFADQTHGPLELAGEPVIPCSEQMCAELGLVGSLPHESVFWYFGDYAFYCALQSIPGFDYYIMIDYDVELVRGNTYALESLIARLMPPGSPPLDHVGPFFGPANPEWCWSWACKGVFPKHYGSFFPLIVLSCRAAEYLYEWRRREAANPPANGQYIMSEAFVPSALMAAGGFSCAELNSLLPGCSDRSTFRVLPPMQMGNLPAFDRTIEFVHPVYSEKEYRKSDRSNPHGLPMSPEPPQATRGKRTKLSRAAAASRRPEGTKLTKPRRGRS